jgi:hypothetical protein
MDRDWRVFLPLPLMQALRVEQARSPGSSQAPLSAGDEKVAMFASFGVNLMNWPRK